MIEKSEIPVLISRFDYGEIGMDTFNIHILAIPVSDPGH